jgi:hypothetical protein
VTPFEAELTAGDQTYTLYFSIAAICALEGRLNKGFSAIGSGDAGHIDHARGSSILGQRRTLRTEEGTRAY